MSILICADDKATVTFGGVDPSCDASSIAYSSVVADRSVDIFQAKN